MNTLSVKEEARLLVESMTEDSTWDDLMERIYVRMAVERGLKDSREGHTLELGEVRARYGLEP